jgi:hypothetical protein
MLKKKPLPDGIKRVNALVETAWIRRIDEWRRHQPDIPSVSESIRRLVDLGINSEKKPAGKKRDA